MFLHSIAAPAGATWEAEAPAAPEVNMVVITTGPGVALAVIWAVLATGVAAVVAADEEVAGAEM